MGGLNKWVIFTSFIFQESQKYCGTTDCDPCLLESFIIILMIISIIRPICFVPKWEFCVLLNFMFRPPTVRPHLWPQARAGCYKIIVYSSPLLMTALLPTILSLLERSPLVRARTAYIHSTLYLLPRICVISRGVSSLDCPLRQLHRDYCIILVTSSVW